MNMIHEYDCKWLLENFNFTSFLNIFVSNLVSHRDTGLFPGDMDVDFTFWSPACNGQSKVASKVDEK